MSAADTLILGAGVDGLVAALTLARAGRKAVVLDGRDAVGGVAAGREFAPGYRHVGVLHDSALVAPAVLEATDLRAHGLQTRARPSLWAGGVRIDAEAVVGDLPAGDARGYRALRTLRDDLRPALVAVLGRAPPDVRPSGGLAPLVERALGLRLHGRQRITTLLKRAPSALDDLLSEYVSDPRLRAALALPALLGTWMAPLSPTSSAAFLFREACVGAEEIAGGPAALVRALEAACAAAGVVVRTGAPVARIRVDDGAVQGVRLADGTDLFASAVLCAVGPKRLLDLLEPLTLPIPEEEALQRVRTRGIVAKVHLALRAPLVLGGAEGVEHAVIADGPLHVERAFDDAKRGRLHARPPLDVRVPTVAEPGLAPDGHHVVSALAYGVPYALEGGWSEEARQRLHEGVIAGLEAHDPAVREKVVVAEVVSPMDLERRYGLHGGHLDHGEVALDQLWALRPTPGLAGYRTPVRGLYLGSRGAHPAGLTGLPGLLAARAMVDGRRVG